MAFCQILSKTDQKAITDQLSIDFFLKFNLNVVGPDWMFLDCAIILSMSDVVQYFVFNLFPPSLFPLLLFTSNSLWSSVFLVLAHALSSYLRRN